MTELDTNYIGIGLALGAGLGVTLGAVIGAVTGDLGLWIALGPSIGAAVGLAIAAGLGVRQDLSGVCPKCGYSRKGLRSGTCPECGEDLFDIRDDDLTAPEVVALLREHLDSVALHSPPESVHALDLEGLRAPAVTFWSIWQGSELVGCGALKELDATHGEIKSMRTASTHLRKGVAKAALEHMLTVARTRGYRRLSLETGSMAAFAPAHALYARSGFERCGPFADYVEDPNSIFMTRELGNDTGTTR